MSLQDLLDIQKVGGKQFIMFGGKGGVGKTSMAAATALHFAKERARRRKDDPEGKQASYGAGKILIFTTDPAPSLADSFGQKIGNEPTAIQGVKNLFAMEIDAKIVLEEFKKEYGENILDILQQGTYLADEEVEEIFSLDIPGLDEVMGLKKITDFMDPVRSQTPKASADSTKPNRTSNGVDSQEYDLYIVDTAPTGHTLRLLSLPELLDDWIKFLASLRWKYHAMVRQFARKERVEKADEFLLEMKRTVKKVRELLQDEKRTEFVVVTIAETMGVRETEDLISTLEQFHIPSRHIIINNIFPKEASEFAKIKRKNQEKYIDEIKKKFGKPRHQNSDRFFAATSKPTGYSSSGNSEVSLSSDGNDSSSRNLVRGKHVITEVLLQADEIQGIKSLENLGEQLFANDVQIFERSSR